MNSLPKTVIRQRRDCDLNPGPSAPESSTLTTRLPSHPTCTRGIRIVSTYRAVERYTKRRAIANPTSRDVCSHLSVCLSVCPRCLLDRDDRLVWVRRHWNLAPEYRPTYTHQLLTIRGCLIPRPFCSLAAHPLSPSCPLKARTYPCNHLLTTDSNSAVLSGVRSLKMHAV